MTALPRARLIASCQILAHVPDLIFSGSKPSREIERRPELHDEIAHRLRSQADAESYFPNHVFIGAEDPRPLTAPGGPWWNRPGELKAKGDNGVMFSQGEFMGALRYSDSTGLLHLYERACEYDATSSSGQLVDSMSGDRQAFEGEAADASIPGRSGPLGTVSWGYPGDQALAPGVVLENLIAKTSAALALAECLRGADMDPGSLDLVISCSEEAIGDRYQRGGGNLGKAVAEMVGASRASGFDIKDFCAGPIPSLVVASSLVETGVADTVAVVAGGSLPKLGMKFEGHLKSGMPVLEDCLGGWVAIVAAGETGPRIRLDAVGRHPVDAGGSNQGLFNELVMVPLERLGLKIDDVDLIGTELHNPELTEPQGSGNVPERNYRMIAALAVQAGHIDRTDMERFLAERCVSGFSPTQGHIASAVCLLPHVLHMMKQGTNRALLVAKASLFLGRMSSLANGMSVVIEQ